MDNAFRRVFLFLVSSFSLCSLSPVQDAAAELIEKHIEHRVAKGEYGAIISGKVGLNWSYVARENNLDPYAVLTEGTVLRMEFKRIVPERIENGLIINIPDRTLYRFENGRLKDYYFIAPGRPDWQTPLGEFVVKAKTKEPTWHVPPSIQREMEAEGKDVLLEVPPGPDNPLGEYWLQLSLQGIGLHGTNAPQSIYRFRSHGCLRLRPEVAKLLFDEVKVGTPGKILYRPVKMDKGSDGSVSIEVYKDVYKKGIDYNREVEALITGLNVADKVDRDKIQRALEKKDGIVRDVGR